MDDQLVYERKVTAADEGSDWLYINPAKQSRHRVEISMVPDKAQRIRIQHLDRDMGGRSEWVPIARAKVPWSLRTSYEATNAKLRALESHRPLTAHSDVAFMLLGGYVGESVAESYGNGVSGALVIHDVDQLARLTQLSREALTSHEDTIEDGAIFAPWPTTLRVLKALCEHEPRPALEMLGKYRADEQEFALEVAKEGDPWWTNKGGDDSLLAKRVRQWHQMRIDSVRFLQALLDAEVPSLADDFLELRAMYIDLVQILPDAIARIRTARSQVAETLADELQQLIDRALPASSELLGAEMPARMPNDTQDV